MAEQFDVVVAGSGMGGLTAASLLTARGFRTLLLERQRAVGGYLSDFQRGPYQFDSAAGFVGAIEKDAEVGEFLGEIGLADRIEFLPVQNNVRVIWPDGELNTRRLPYVEALAAAFPDRRGELERLKKILESIGADLVRFTRLSGWRRWLFPFLCPRLLRYGRATLGGLIERELHDPALAALAASFPATAAPSELSLLFAAALITKGQQGGLYRPVGGLGRFAHLIAQSAADHGADLRTGEALAAIEHDGRRIRAVRTTAGRRIETQAVVVGFNPDDALGLLDGPETRRIRSARQRTARFRYSTSAFVVYLGLKPATDWAKEFFFTTIFETLDLDRVYGTLRDGKIPDQSVIYVCFPSAAGTNNENDAPTARIMTPMPYDPFARWRAEGGEEEYRRRKSELAERLIERVCRHMSWLREAIVMSEAASPLTLEHWTGNRRGAMYGLEPTVDQFGPSRWPNKGVLGGLYFCGHYSRPSHGIAGTCYSGRFAADLVTRDLR